jgi:putative hemin transport protein
MSNTNLKSRFDGVKAENKALRIRDIAKKLGVTEVEVLVLGCEEHVTRLNPQFSEILMGVEELGYVMALTRNDDVVHERKGFYLNGDFSSPHASMFVGADIDLRIFFRTWKSAFAVAETSKDKTRFSLQFFNDRGEAVHKIYMESTSNIEKYQELVVRFKSEDQSKIQEVDSAVKPVEVELPDSEIDKEGFQTDWKNLKDTHDFFGMMRNHKVTRTQALRLAPADLAESIDNDGLRKILNLAVAKQVNIMVFVGNDGMIQIHTGEIKNVVDFKEWINILDPKFNLHLRENAITQTWIVRKPTTDGIVTSLELFNAEKELICTLFGARKPGIPELESWREIVREISQQVESV